MCIAHTVNAPFGRIADFRPERLKVPPPTPASLVSVEDGLSVCPDATLEHHDDRLALILGLKQANSPSSEPDFGLMSITRWNFEASISNEGLWS